MGEPTRIPRSIATAERRVESWLKVDPGVYGTDLDSGAYRAIVERLVDVMNAVGPADAVVGLTALTKTTALMLAAMLRLEDDAKVEELCNGQGAWIANEVMALRNSLKTSKRSN